jgi:DNA-binding transcriptional MerR regulator/methylmalonyl-CoA mutase cobalamin-binding subunit
MSGSLVPAGDVPRHPIRLVTQRTGLSGHVLRAWERRYGVVAPTRSDGGQRLYSDADIERLLLLRRLTEAGGSISQLAHLAPEDLRRLAETEAPLAEVVVEESAEPWQAGAMRAVESLDGSALRRELSRAVLALGVPRFLDQVVSPLLRDVGTRWHSGQLGIAHEHLTSAVVREVLGWIRESSETIGKAPTLVVGTPAQQLHEGGALLAAAAAAAEGWRVIYLGVNLPGRDIAAAARGTGARAVALSIIHPTGDPQLGAQLEAIRTDLPSGTALLVGGAAAESYRAAIDAAGGRVLSGLADFRDLLQQLGGDAA